MNEKQISDLKEAVKYSPDNIPLRLLLAQNLLEAGLLEDAEKEYLFIVDKSSNHDGKLGLAKVYYAKRRFSACNVILEELVDQNQLSDEVLELHTQALIKENNIAKAMDVYRALLSKNPSYRNEEIDIILREKNQSTVNDDPEFYDHRFLEKPDIRFSDVGGMENVKKEIELKIIKPLLHPEIYKAYGKKTGGGILLYGPPGCGKTYIAKATAGEVNAKFITVGLNDILDMWVGSSEKNLHELFELARENTPTVLFIDEIDALGASRTDMKRSSGRHLINQFLQELDGVNHNNDGVLIIGATNTPWNLDPAFRRPGRFDRILFVPPPDHLSRELIFNIKLKGKPTESIDYAALAKRTPKCSGADIEAIIDIAIEQKLEESFIDGIPKPLSTKDLLNATNMHKASTQDWFATAKNYAMFANDSGLYDDILKYLNIKR